MPSDAPERREPAITMKSILLGLVGVLVLALLTGYNGEYLKQSGLADHQFALVPFGGLLLIAGVWNPVWRRLAPGLVCSGREMVVYLAMTAAAAWVSAASFARHFYNQLIMPWIFLDGENTWQHFRLLEHLPAWMFPVRADRSHPAYDTVYNDFTQGLEPGGAIPWGPWIVTGLQWLPVILVFVLMIVALAMVVHRQWSRHEQLAYPLAQVAGSLMERDAGARLPRVFAAPAFRVGVALVVAVQLVRLGHAWFPENVPELSLGNHLGFLWRVMPGAQGSGLQQIEQFHFFFLIVGLAYFVPLEISLTFGLSHMLLYLFGVEFYLSTGQRLNGSTHLPAMRSGAYLTYAVMICWVGRHYYLQLLRRAFGLGSGQRDAADADGVWAARVFLLAALAFWIILVVGFRMDLLVGLLFLLIVLAIILVFARIICETGIPYMQAYLNPGLILGTFAGPAFLGPTAVVVTYYAGTIFLPDISNSLMPFLNNTMRVGDQRRVRPALIAGVACAAILVALVASFGGRLWQYYEYGTLTGRTENYASEHVPKKYVRAAGTGFLELEEAGLLLTDEGADQRRTLRRDAAGLPVATVPRSGMARLTDLQPDRQALWLALIGAAGVALFWTMRLRFASFPLHPVLFLVWGTYPMWLTAYGFLIGWGAKKMILGFGGGRAYQTGRPFFLGLVVGDLLMALVGVLVGLAYHLLTGRDPVPFVTFGIG